MQESDAYTLVRVLQANRTVRIQRNRDKWRFIIGPGSPGYGGWKSHSMPSADWKPGKPVVSFSTSLKAGEPGEPVVCGVPSELKGLRTRSSQVEDQEGTDSPT